LASGMPSAIVNGSNDTVLNFPRKASNRQLYLLRLYNRQILVV
jgi:hypothetical protein